MNQPERREEEEMEDGFAEPARPAHVLVVDDEATVREILERALGGAGYIVEEAADGEEAIRALARGGFDVVISDVRMPGLSGVEVLRAVKEISPDTEVVVVTGYATLKAAIECIRGGAFDLVLKPFHLTEIVSTVSRAIERRRLRDTAALYRASQAVFRCGDPQELPRRIVEVAREAMGADDASLMLPGEDGRLYIAHATGVSPEIRAEARLALGERIAGRVAQDRSPVLLQGIPDDPRFAGASRSEVRSSIVYPLLSGERLLGVLNLNRSTNPRSFRQADLERAAILAAQVALALDNANLFRRAMGSERLAAMGALAASITHEINNPVTYVLTNLEHLGDGFVALADLGRLLDEGAAREEILAWWARHNGPQILSDLDQAVTDASDGVNHIRAIVRDMRALARADSGADATFDLNEAVRAALRLASVEVKRRASVAADLGADLLVRGSAGQISQVFVNLLVNASQALEGRTGGRIRVSTRREAGRVVAEVSDNGSGVRPEHLRRIFEPFFTTKPAGAGTGLGLPISLDIVRNHGGEISVESQPERGATFTVRLPAAAPDARASGPRAGENGTRARLLCIDDEPAIRRSYRRILGREHDVTLAEGGADALAILSERQDFDLILCDILMPGLNGMELFQRVSQIHPGLDRRFLFVTGGATQKEVQEFLRTVRNEVVEKPFDVQLLCRVVARHTRAAPASA
jgi:signal transduction histidine kinase